MMRNRKFSSLAAGLVLAAIAVSGALPAAASARTVYVNAEATPHGRFSSCSEPGYQHIEEALKAPATAIYVCPLKAGASYSEQLTVERPVTINGNNAVLTVPSSPQDTSTPCDSEVETVGPKTPDQDLISVCTSGKVTISKLHIEAIWPGEPVEGESCGYSLFGILAAGGVNLDLNKSIVEGAIGSKLNGCQYGIGVQVGVGGTATPETATATILDDGISDYQKNGITISGEGTSAVVNGTTVTGAGPTPTIAQNGIGVQEGARAVIEKSTVTGNECNEGPQNADHCGSNLLEQYGGDGVYFYDSGASTLESSNIRSNDIGVEAWEESAVTPVIQKTNLERNRDVSVLISEGSASVNKDTMTGSDAGVELLQFSGQAQAVGGSGTDNTITGMSQWAVFGRSDNQPGDLAGSFLIEHSKISGNPGKLAAESVDSESTTLKIYAEKDT